ncbi:hypothetical protein [Roseomonas xinghualingensis]|uniref:hypothetical protein n=1 Tax=Roseomonas xinghualingensis TaxID=2986475 RepID=UPI00298DE727|nr:hypothetical protein [Roseomonas sp. SXEYE001]
MSGGAPVRPAAGALAAPHAMPPQAAGAALGTTVEGLSAEEAAQVVLTDDNFASIAAAVREGRTVRDNLRKAVVFMLPINGGESLSVLLAVLLGTTLPITGRWQPSA